MHKNNPILRNVTVIVLLSLFLVTPAIYMCAIYRYLKENQWKCCLFWHHCFGVYVAVVRHQTFVSLPVLMICERVVLCCCFCCAYVYTC